MDRYTAQRGLGKMTIQKSAFSMWDREGNEYRYDPQAPRTHNSGTCSTVNKDLGEWSRYDMKDNAQLQPSYELNVWLQYHTKFIVQPESIAEDEAWIISRLNGPPRVRKWKLACLPFKPSSEPVPSEAVVVPWNVQCDLDKYGNLRLFSASAKGKFYFFCPIAVGTDSSTVTNLYIYDSDTGLTQGPRRFQASLDNLKSEDKYMSLVSGSIQDTDPAFAILTISSSRRIVIDLRTANGSLPDWEEFPHPDTIELEPECSTKGINTKLIVACTLSALFLASFAFQNGNLLFVLVKSDSLKLSSNTTWSIVSTVPFNYFLSIKYHDYGSADSVTSHCRVEDDGTFTMWGSSVVIFRYDPHDPVRSYTGTCNAGYSTLGEWSRRDILIDNSLRMELQSFVSLPDEGRLISPGSSNSDDSFSWVIGFDFVADVTYPPKIKLLRFQDTGSVIDLRGKVFNQELIMENSRRVVTNVVHGDGLMYAILQTGYTETDLSTIGMARNWTLAHFPFNSQQIANGVLPPITSVPWVVNCDPGDDFNYDFVAATAKGKLYFLCSVYDAPSNRTVSNLYIHDSSTTPSSTPPTTYAKFDFPASYFKQFTFIEDEGQPRYVILTGYAEDGPAEAAPGLVFDLQQGSQVPPMWLRVYNLPDSGTVAIKATYKVTTPTSADTETPAILTFQHSFDASTSDQSLYLTNLAKALNTLQESINNGLTERLVQQGVLSENASEKADGEEKKNNKLRTKAPGQHAPKKGMTKKQKQEIQAKELAKKELSDTSVSGSTTLAATNSPMDVDSSVASSSLSSSTEAAGDVEMDAQEQEDVSQEIGNDRDGEEEEEEKDEVDLVMEADPGEVDGACLELPKEQDTQQQQTKKRNNGSEEDPTIKKSRGSTSE
ncbi:hypothetical protein BGZ94_007350 [Podila epigama]|nr:hypothetical protein BGZ94_007350 [Podila epigama]